MGSWIYNSLWPGASPLWWHPHPYSALQLKKYFCLYCLELHLSLVKVKAEQILLLLFLDEETGPLSCTRSQGRASRRWPQAFLVHPGAAHCKPSSPSPASAHGKQNQQGIEFIPGQPASPLGKLHPGFSLMWLWSRLLMCSVENQPDES